MDDDEHVLVLDFEDSSKGQKMSNGLLAPPPALTPAATKKLVERRNERFERAIHELIEATPKHEDPVVLLQAAARDHIPIDPNNKASLANIAASQGPRQVPEPANRPSIESVLEEIRQQEWYNGQIVYDRTVDAKEGQTAALDELLPESVAEALQNARSISSFYTHQVAAINALEQGEHVIVSTSTASGKSVIYQVPFLRFLEQDHESTAIFIYPTKALAQDQKQALEQLLAACPGMESINVATYDGDTPQEERRAIRESASVIFTNFDMMHFSILPHEELWRRFLKNLKLVAVDELHYYSGTFGSHVAQVLRRFRRICAAVGNRHVRFVSCSATITNPGKYMRQMFGVDDVEEITEDGAPSGRKDYLVWDPPPIDPMIPALGRQSALQEATRLARFLMERGIRLIVFCTIRKSCELFFKALRAELTAHGRLDILKRVMSYRGGYTAADRRRIEKEAFEGNLLGIVATNALELGVDIGVLDAVMMFGFPRGGLASFRQQAGRAGRRARDALAVFIASDFPIDRHFVAHPDELFDKPVSELVVDIENEVFIEAHLQCAGQEMPLSVEDEKYFGPLMKEICESRLVKDQDGWYHTHPKFLPHPAKHISLRGSNDDEYSVVDVSRLARGGTARILETMETSRALFELYEGAVFIHQGLTFIIQEVSHDSKMAKLIRSDVNWTTEPRDFTNVDPTQTYRIREIRNSPHRAYYGKIDLYTLVFGYFKIRNKTIIDAVDVETPPYERESTGVWIDIPKATLGMMRAHGIHPAEAIHAAEHAFLNRFALAQDMGTECKPAEKEYKATPSQRKRPARLIFYEAAGRKGGSATKAFDHVSSILNDAHDAVEACECEEGCAACVVSPSCRENNLVSSKRGALIVLKAILGRPIDEDLLTGPENPEIHETVVAAEPVRATQDVQVEQAD
ncbi:DEAD/DEAH box helicase [Phanerochaete sordida]|uniref:DEAD/DEAH box helicase n=1 Tax=Phanerochaete sordida TaxID=48140 RepID=A0A9P3L9W7_9APHY|nr:DEAD/DEAH box helicase [Phanerochaete sordida]